MGQKEVKRNKAMKMKILILHGPNLNLLGEREPEIYGRVTLAEINRRLEETAAELGVELKIVQSNYEGALVEEVHRAAKECAGIVLNLAAYTHTSVALRDALAAVGIPGIEVHLSNIYAREDFRWRSLTAPVLMGQISGLGADGYLWALRALVKKLTTG